MSRSNLGGMDFEYQNQSGPVDPSSPFVQHARAAQQQRPSSEHSMGTKRPFSAFNSPAKNSGFADLRPPASSQTWLFDQPPSASNPAFSTPRTSRELEIPSSGPETSPDVGNTADSESNTPDMGLFAKLSKSSAAVKQFIANKEDTPPPQASPTSKAKGVSGRGDLVRDTYSNRVVKRVMRRRKENVDRQLALRKNSSDSDYDPSDPNDSRPGSSSAHGKYPRGGSSSIASFFTFIEHHPNLPHIFSFYAQCALNIFFALGLMYLVWSFWSTIRADVDKRTEEAELDVLATIARCTREFVDNGCASERLVRALEQPCGEWKKCMDQDVKNVGRSRLSATTFAEIFNSFVEPISWKTLTFVVVLCLTFLVGSNGAFWFFRHKLEPGPYHAVPSTPQHYPSGGYYNPSQHGTPYWGPPPSTPGSRYPGWRMETPSRREIGGQSPSRRLEWDR